MSRFPTLSPNTMDFLGNLDRQENGLPENQRREFELAVETELEDVLEAFNAEVKNVPNQQLNDAHLNNK
ncbi:unnamed protein product [Strongylus vulgaris]|uniref:Uncharacterized protein n=1 Tax=Strongylus vulgaris TaxID=40348 RepID=A0A3P7IF89_STRVU|nr:unnamed protein product [Strongylus vulgaris]